MKTRLLFLLFLLGSSFMFLAAQTRYEVTANTFLNIRSAPSVEAPVVGTIDRGGEVDVYNIENGWAKIAYDGGYAYVSSDYLRQKVSTPVKVEKSTSSWFQDFDLATWGKSWDAKGLVYVIAGLSVLLWFIRLMRGEDALDGVWYVINCILFSLVMVLELVYSISMGGEATWFCNPEKVGWLWMVVNFIAFGLLIYNQLHCFINTLEDMICDSGGGFESKWGVNSLKWGLPIGVIGAIISPGIASIVVIAVLCCQLVQVINIYRGIVPHGGWGYATLISLLYLLGTIATVLLLVHFLVMLVIVIVALFLLQMFAKSGSNVRRCCSNCSHYGAGTCHLDGQYISNASGTVCDRFN